MQIDMIMAKNHDFYEKRLQKNGYKNKNGKKVIFVYVFCVAWHDFLESINDIL